MTPRSFAAPRNASQRLVGPPQTCGEHEVGRCLPDDCRATADWRRKGELSTDYLCIRSLSQQSHRNIDAFPATQIALMALSFSHLDRLIWRIHAFTTRPQRHINAGLHKHRDLRATFFAFLGSSRFCGHCLSHFDLFRSQSLVEFLGSASASPWLFGQSTHRHHLFMRRFFSLVARMHCTICWSMLFYSKLKAPHRR